VTTGAEPAAAPVSAAPDTVRRTRRRRRPSGAPPPLPRSIGFSGKGWLVALVWLLLWVVIAMVSERARRLTESLDAALLRQIARLRTEWLTDIFEPLNRIAMGWAVTAAAVALIVLLVAFRRWRHLFTFLGSVFALEFIGAGFHSVFARPRPFDVTIIGLWRGYSFPSPQPAVVSFIAVGVVYSLVVPGRPRTVAKSFAIALVAVLAAARLYLGVDHPFDVLVGIALGVAIPLNAFRFFTPNEVFPVAYGGGKTAHLDVGGRRGEAIRQAVEEQLGVTVLEIKPVGLAGSGGSTPLRLRVAGDPDTYLFGKLYAMNHVRADRWYKIGRTILYGRLEDETPFQSVRRLVQYEDYTLRLMRDAGIPTPAPAGIVELTPEREYLLVTEFLEAAVEIGDAVVDDDIIDQGLMIVRNLWDAGLAHRDIKPANLMIKDGRVYVIDVAFAQVRPSPWREAVDLANMMLVLAVRTDPERVYRHALEVFTPDEIAEAFAAARGIASPSQLRSVMKQDGRDLVTRFRDLAPERRPISLQRWGIRRVAYAVVLVVGLILGTVATFQLFTPADLIIEDTPDCGTGNLMVLVAQSVPSATSVPCVASVPAGWHFGGINVRQDRTRFWLDSDEGGARAVEVSLLPPDECAVDGATEVPSDQVGMQRFEQPEQLPPELRSVRSYIFDGGCVTYRFAFHGAASASLMFDVDTALDFEPRSALVDEVDRDTGLSLCGVEAPPCVGGS
jgi:tRNA A-37 threonylcarbamoyl transferase component Bud32/membrane-associated phospholipid phosphatase